MTNNEILKKQIIYRSIHRGIKEMDLLLGSFVEQNIDKFNDSELKDLKALMMLEDEILYQWYFMKTNDDLIPINNVSRMLKNFKL